MSAGMEDGGSGVKDSVVSIGTFLAAALVVIVKWGVVIIAIVIVYFIICHMLKSDDEIDISKLSPEERKALMDEIKKEDKKVDRADTRIPAYKRKGNS